MERPFSLKQVEGYLGSPEVRVRRLAMSAKRAILRVLALEAEKSDLERRLSSSVKSSARRVLELETEKRAVEERLAAAELDRVPTIAVLVYKDGRVEVYGHKSRQRVVMVPVPALPERMNAEAAELLEKKLPYEMRGAVLYELYPEIEQKLEVDQEVVRLTTCSSAQCVTVSTLKEIELYRKCQALVEENARLQVVVGAVGAE